MCILLGVMDTPNLGLPRHVVLSFFCELIGPVRPDSSTPPAQEKDHNSLRLPIYYKSFPHESCTPEVTSCPVCAC
jgi:hypothetical protein